MRKILKEKVDKRIRDQFFKISDDYGRFHEIFINVLEDEKTNASNEIRSHIISKTREKTWDFLGKLKEFNSKIIQEARPNKVELVDSPLSSKDPKDMRGKIQDLVKDEINRNIPLEKEELTAFASSYIEKSFYRILHEKIQEKKEIVRVKFKKRKNFNEVPAFDMKTNLKSFIDKVEMN